MDHSFEIMPENFTKLYTLKVLCIFCISFIVLHFILNSMIFFFFLLMEIQLFVKKTILQDSLVVQGLGLDSHCCGLGFNPWSGN